MGITVWQKLSEEAGAMARGALKDVRALSDWKKIRPRRHREFMRCLGLDPMPERCDLKITGYGSFKGRGFSARKIAFQVFRDCWSSACVYYPEPLPAARMPGVLYLCGHAALGTYHYQYHPIMWARRGYVCLIVDTIEQSDNPGEHHGCNMGRLDGYLSLGYTPAGGEALNSIRALDVLAADEHVDPGRLAATGVSGGGSCSFLLAAADERVRAVSTLCGISTPLDAIANRHLMNHCDCFYPLNVYRRDISEYAALIAPRAALFCFADHDPLFHPAETRALVERTRKIYRLYGKNDRCRLLTCPGPHGDHPEFDAGTSRWFDRHLSAGRRPLLERGKIELPESVTSVFNGCPPKPNRLELLPQLISPRGAVPLPQARGDWKEMRRKALESLDDEAPSVSSMEECKNFMTLDGDWHVTGGKTPIKLQTHRGTIAGMDVWLRMVAPPGARSRLVLGVGNEGETWANAFSRVACNVDIKSVIYGGFEPRMCGFGAPASKPDLFPPGARLSSVRTHMLRAMALAGATPVMMTIRDIRAVVEYVLGLPEAKKCELYLYGHGDAGVAALYAGILDVRIAGVAAEHAPSSHLDGSPVLGVLRAFDMPHAVGLMAPRKVALVSPGHSCWTWPTRVYERLGCPGRFIRADDLRDAFEKLLFET